jgi:hypothetical protein
MKFQVLTVASMKMAVFWVVAPCSLPRRFRGACCLDCQDDDGSDDGVLMMEGASTSETSVNFYQAMRRNNLEDSHLLSTKHLLLHFSGFQIIS